jgi:hypothetical protein
VSLLHRFTGACGLLDLALEERSFGAPTIACRVGDLSDAHEVLIDTAAHWSVLSAELAQGLGSEPVPGLPQVLVSSRLGLFRGWLDRFRLTFDAQEGASIAIDVTCFVSPDWSGPTVLGWQGGLDRFFFAIQPDEQRFYYAPL